MSTNYTFYLKQEKPGVQRYRQQRKIDNRIFLQTKGFNAKAVDCGKDVTEVRHSSRSMSCERYDDHENTGCPTNEESNLCKTIKTLDCLIWNTLYNQNANIILQ